MVINFFHKYLSDVNPRSGSVLGARSTMVSKRKPVPAPEVYSQAWELVVKKKKKIYEKVESFIL